MLYRNIVIRRFITVAIACGSSAAYVFYSAKTYHHESLNMIHDNNTVVDEPDATVVDMVDNTPIISKCQEGMILIDGDHCTNVRQTCLDWLEDPIKNKFARCHRFKESSCIGEKVKLSFCIDREEYAVKDEVLPKGDTSWNEAKATCEGMGKRLCQEREWVFACEGEEMKPYPYGYVRDPSICNFELDDLVNNIGDLRDKRLPFTANLQCLSPFGVHNMVGNIDEWVVLDRPHFSAINNGRRMISGLKGGWWGPLRNRCRPTTVDHDEVFHQLQTGFRCCTDKMIQ